MKKIFILILCSLVSISAQSAQSYSYKCNPFKSNTDAFLSDGFVTLLVSETSFSFKYFYVDNATKETRLEVDAIYTKSGTIEGNSKIAGMGEYVLSKEIKKWPGDKINVLYVDTSLSTGGDPLKIGGRGGRLTFLGHGYSYDWNLCKTEK